MWGGGGGGVRRLGDGNGVPQAQGHTFHTVTLPNNRFTFSIRVK